MANPFSLIGNVMVIPSPFAQMTTNLKWQSPKFKAAMEVRAIRRMIFSNNVVQNLGFFMYASRD
jgi:hypothetical protein